jgi:hypothetical protein
MWGRRRDRAAALFPDEPQTKDRGATWLRNAMLALGLLAVAAAVVSWTAQFRLVFAVKHLTLIAALEASIPDASAFIFASLGIALALHGRRAIRPRALNVAAVGVSIFMNAIAAAPGWRDMAIWVMPAVAYAVASDTLIGVIRARAIAKARAMRTELADDETTPLAVLGGLLLWLLRLTLAPRSTLVGFRSWVVEEVPMAPGRRAVASASTPPAIEGPKRPRRGHRRAGTDTKTAKFVALVVERHGPLATFPIGDVSKVSGTLAPEVDLNPGAARTALRKQVLAAQNGDAR